MPPQVTNAELKILIENLTKDVSMCSRTLRGSNGDTGLVTAVTVISDRLGSLEKKVGMLELKITNDLIHALREYSEEKPVAKFGSWEWFTEKAAMPISVAVIVSLMTWFLTKVLPQIATTVGK